MLSITISATFEKSHEDKISTTDNVRFFKRYGDKEEYEFTVKSIRKFIEELALYQCGN